MRTCWRGQALLSIVTLSKREWAEEWKWLSKNPATIKQDSVRRNVLRMYYRHGKLESYLHESRAFLMPAVTEECLSVRAENKL